MDKHRNDQHFWWRFLWTTHSIASRTISPREYFIIYLLLLFLKVTNNLIHCNYCSAFHMYYIIKRGWYWCMPHLKFLFFVTRISNFLFVLQITCHNRALIIMNNVYTFWWCTWNVFFNFSGLTHTIAPKLTFIYFRLYKITKSWIFQVKKIKFQYRQ